MSEFSQKSVFWKNFIYYCNLKDIKPNTVTKAIGLSNATATDWKNGSTPRDTTLKKIADYFGVPVTALTEDSPALEIKSNAIILDPAKTRMIPVYESVSAGFGVMAQNLILEYMPIYIHSDSEADETICIKVTGDSMSPNIENGDIIQVHKQTSVDSGSIAVVLVDGDEALVKKVTYGANFVELHSFNPAYPPIRFEGADLMRIQVIGLVKNTLKNPQTHRSPTEKKLHDLMRQMSPDQLDEFTSYAEYLINKKK